MKGAAVQIEPTDLITRTIEIPAAHLAHLTAIGRTRPVPSEPRELIRGLVARALTAPRRTQHAPELHRNVATLTGGDSMQMLAMRFSGYRPEQIAHRFGLTLDETTRHLDELDERAPSQDRSHQPPAGGPPMTTTAPDDFDFGYDVPVPVPVSLSKSHFKILDDLATANGTTVAALLRAATVQIINVVGPQVLLDEASPAASEHAPEPEGDPSVVTLYPIADDELRRLHASGLNDTQIAGVLGCSADTVYRRRDKIRLAANVHGRPATMAKST